MVIDTHCSGKTTAVISHLPSCCFHDLHVVSLRDQCARWELPDLPTPPPATLRTHAASARLHFFILPSSSPSFSCPAALSFSSSSQPAAAMFWRRTFIGSYHCQSECTQKFRTYLAAQETLACIKGPLGLANNPCTRNRDFTLHRCLCTCPQKLVPSCL